MRRVAGCRLPVARERGSLRGRSSATGNWQLATVLTLIVLLLAQPLFACPVCYGNPDDPMVKATNKGIWVLLGVVGFVQVGFAALFLSFWKRARDQKRFRDQFHIVEGGPLS